MSMVVRVMGILALVLGCSTAQAQNKVPSERGLEALVKTTLLSFNDANVTGNYEVFSMNAEYLVPCKVDIWL